MEASLLASNFVDPLYFWKKTCFFFTKLSIWKYGTHAVITIWKGSLKTKRAIITKVSLQHKDTCFDHFVLLYDSSWNTLAYKANSFEI